MKIFVSGGAKNGKSSFAQNKAAELAADGRPLYYIATMIPTDDEDRARIRRHVEDRDGMGFITLEQPRDIAGLLEPGDGERRADPSGVFLLDSVTALLANEMFRDGAYDPEAGEKVAEDLTRFCALAEDAVFVSDYIYSEARRFDEFTENYRRSLALVDRRLAALCDAVCEVCYGTVLCRKGTI